MSFQATSERNDTLFNTIFNKLSQERSNYRISH